MKGKTHENDPKEEESAPILGDKELHEQHQSLGFPSSFQKLLHNSIFRTAVRNASLILTW